MIQSQYFVLVRTFIGLDATADGIFNVRQCAAIIKKRQVQCRNAALVEYVFGPRPIYCAQHVDLDPNSLLMKCKTSSTKDSTEQVSILSRLLFPVFTCAARLHIEFLLLLRHDA